VSDCLCVCVTLELELYELEESMVEEEGARNSTAMALNAQRKHKKKQVCESVLAQLVLDGVYDAAAMPAFADQLQAHFNRLPTR
jgi:hypothetical protein